MAPHVLSTENWRLVSSSLVQFLVLSDPRFSSGLHHEDTISGKLNQMANLIVLRKDDDKMRKLPVLLLLVGQGHILPFLLPKYSLNSTRRKREWGVTIRKPHRAQAQTMASNNDVPEPTRFFRTTAVYTATTRNSTMPPSCDFREMQQLHNQHHRSPFSANDEQRRIPFLSRTE